MPGILPPLSTAEALEVTRIHSVAGLLAADRPLITSRPLRSPHYSASVAALVGGGPGPRPGEVSLAHRGVLVLDEFAEFQRPALEALRQPLEDGVVSIARVGGRAVFPARFQLVAAMNLCPCGARGDPAVDCKCSPQRLSAYRDKLSRALLDRFDLSSPCRDRARPSSRPLPARRPTRCAIGLPPRVVDSNRAVPSGRKRRSSSSIARWSGFRSRDAAGRVRVASPRPIAALAGEAAVGAEHLAEALAYRSPTELGAP